MRSPEQGSHRPHSLRASARGWDVSALACLADCSQPPPGGPESSLILVGLNPFHTQEPRESVLNIDMILPDLNVFNDLPFI